ncbi:hypothetical protein RRG08_053191 [Elysia crispata]|uniref:Fibronectin type-III domain-containing protein n=1 Tax=Elysia crispata TaxID=231223 RepID=A0AAE0YQX2_9GAST|nr:hypothetical protein RRG08_053191 [Elysia crispata]
MVGCTRIQDVDGMYASYMHGLTPGQPVIIPEECSCEGNSVTIAWAPQMGCVVEAYTLELDDGHNGDFRVVYVGREMICTVDGLHFNKIYNARVKAHNHSGESEYSEIISLQTAEGRDVRDLSSFDWFGFFPRKETFVLEVLDVWAKKKTVSCDTRNKQNSLLIPLTPEWRLECLRQPMANNPVIFECHRFIEVNTLPPNDTKV